MAQHAENAGSEAYGGRIFSAFHYYSLTRGLNHTYRLLIGLKQAVDGAILKDAVQMTMRRYPYLLVRRKNTPFETVLIPNPAEVVVKKSDAPIRVGSDESNGHLIAFSYEGNTVYLNVFHGLMDGRGCGNLVKTLLYYYCSSAYDPALSRDGVRVVGDTIAPEEYTDPFPRKVPKDCRAFVKKPLTSRTFHIRDDRRVHTGFPKYRCTIKINENELVKFCRMNDGSPAALMSVVMCRAVARLNPARKKPIRAGVVLDLRPAFRAPAAHHSLNDIIPIDFTEKIEHADFELQNTAFRSQIFVKSDSETVLKNMDLTCRLLRLAQHLPSLALKRLMLGSIVPRRYSENTFMLSYVGKADYGAAQPYVEFVRVDVDTPQTGIVVEISAINGLFYIDTIFDFPEELYLRAFCEELDSLGIGYERGDLQPLVVPKCTY